MIFKILIVWNTTVGGILFIAQFYQYILITYDFFLFTTLFLHVKETCHIVTFLCQIDIWEWKKVSHMLKAWTILALPLRKNHMSRQHVNHMWFSCKIGTIITCDSQVILSHVIHLWFTCDTHVILVPILQENHMWFTCGNITCNSHALKSHVIHMWLTCDSHALKSHVIHMR